MEAEDDWPNYQLDGYGAWLWSLEQHIALSGRELSDGQAEAAALGADYITRLWQQPCSDCWEENADRVHVSTLACIFGGLNASSQLLERSRDVAIARSIRETSLQRAVCDGRLTKWLDGEGIDASLLWAATPFNLLDARDPRMRATLSEIERRRMDESGGVHRYPGDTYYGGGAWLLLTAWLGWHYTRLNRLADARRCLDWVEAHADGRGMPEQVAEHINDAGRLEEWTGRWGTSAHPLLWSHAMHLILLSALE